MYRILINAYAVSPAFGSEPGMGWNWIIHLAKYCKLYVITESEWQGHVEPVLKNSPYRNNIRFYYHPISESARKMSRRQDDWRFYYYYNRWQKKTLELAREIITEHPIDAIHQLNMIGYREPGYLWMVKNVPYVWGPIGGVEQFPTAYLDCPELAIRMKIYAKNFINGLQSRYHLRVQRAISHADAVIAATSGTEAWLRGKRHDHVYCINETGCGSSTDCIHVLRNEKKETFDLVWAGRFYFRKQLGLALQTIALLKDLPEIKLHILGNADPSTDKRYMKMAESLDIQDKCIWYGDVDIGKVHETMAKSDLFFFTSVMDATSTVVLEAIQNHLPIICHDTCGFGPLIDDTVGRKIAVSNPSQSAQDFAKVIRHFFFNRKELFRLSANCEKKHQELSWDSKAQQMVEIYRQAIAFRCNHANRNRS